MVFSGGLKWSGYLAGSGSGIRMSSSMPVDPPPLRPPRIALSSKLVRLLFSRAESLLYDFMAYNFQVRVLWFYGFSRGLKMVRLISWFGIGNKDVLVDAC
jgi:hypothetical protein